MPSRTSILLICGLFLASCNAKSNDTDKVSLKDSLLAAYLHEIDSLPYYDASETNYQVLRAHYYNDTNFLKTVNKRIREEREYRNEWDMKDSCIHQKKLEDLDVDEAYRFIYFPAFCDKTINVTVTKSGDSAILNFLLYQSIFNQVECNIISNFEKRLTQLQWEAFRSKLWAGDIWGLKRENGLHGVDGNSLIFIGFQSGKPWNGPDKIVYGERWEYSSLKDALTYILKISGNKKGCYWVQ